MDDAPTVDNGMWYDKSGAIDDCELGWVLDAVLLFCGIDELDVTVDEAD